MRGGVIGCGPRIKRMSFLPETVSELFPNAWFGKYPNGGASAVVIPELGGTVASLCFPTTDGPREVLFCHEHFWDKTSVATRGGIPLLFPICGRLAEGKYEILGRGATLPIHGFAMRRPWRVMERAEGKLELALTHPSDEHYPFAVELTSCFELRRSEFTLHFTVRNMGEIPMPFSAGWHPYFLTPSDQHGKAAMRVRVPADASGRYESSYTAVSQWGPLLSTSLSPAHPLFKEALHRANDDTASVTWPDGFMVELKTGRSDGDFIPYWQLHTEADKPFICVEPWTSPPNALNSGEGLTHLASNGEWRMQLIIRARDLS